MVSDETGNGADGSQEPGRAAEERRHFLKTTTKFAGVLTVLGLSGDAWLEVVRAQVKTPSVKQGLASPPKGMTVALTARQQTLGNILADAIGSRSVARAIKKHERQINLSEAERNAFNSLTRKELDTLAAVQEKLRPIDAGAWALKTF